MDLKKKKKEEEEEEEEEKKKESVACIYFLGLANSYPLSHF